MRNTLDLYILWIVKYTYTFKEKLTTITIKQIIGLGYFNDAHFFIFLNLYEYYKVRLDYNGAWC